MAHSENINPEPTDSNGREIKIREAFRLLSEAKVEGAGLPNGFPTRFPRNGIVINLDLGSGKDPFEIVAGFPHLKDYLKPLSGMNSDQAFSLGNNLLHQTPLAFSVSELELRNFKCFEHLKLTFRKGATLPGQFNCLVGINGAGKTAVLQAVSLALMGSKATDLHSGRLRTFCRRGNGQRHKAEVGLSLIIEDCVFDMFLPLKAAGVDHLAMVSFEDPYLLEALQESLILAFGQNRNTSKANRPNTDDEHSSLVQGQLTLFDAHAPVAHIECLSSNHVDPRLQPILAQVIADVLVGVDLSPEYLNGRLVFRTKKSRLPFAELPEGYRSILAILAGISAAWLDKNPHLDKVNASEMFGLVLVDEIDLHLHPALQRTLIPNLRKTFPNIQWIVTTNSPLILSCFDREELIILDDNEPAGVRQLDRQIHGFSLDDLYAWLMGTPATNPIVEEKLAKLEAASDAALEEELALLINQSPQRDEAQARAQLEKRRAVFRELNKEIAAS